MHALTVTNLLSSFVCVTEANECVHAREHVCEGAWVRLVQQVFTFIDNESRLLIISLSLSLFLFLSRSGHGKLLPKAFLLILLFLKQMFETDLQMTKIAAAS